MSHQHGPNCNHDHEHEHTQQVRTIQVSEPSKAPADVHIAANYLKDAKKSGMKQRFGVLNGKRFEYFKGKFYFFTCQMFMCPSSSAHPYRISSTRLHLETRTPPQ